MPTASSRKAWPGFGTSLVAALVAVLTTGLVAIAVEPGAAQGVSAPDAGVGTDELGSVLNAYEEAVETLGNGGSSLERAQAIQALSLVASPRYAPARDRWASGPSPDVQEATLRAAVRLGDRSPELKALLQKALASGYAAVLYASAYALEELDLHASFRELWHPDAPPRVWTETPTTWQVPIDRMDGIAAVRPWNDPAWKELSLDTRLALLARAGSREATEQLVVLLGTPGPPPAESWHVTSEPVDTANLRAMLLHPNADIRALAGVSLAKAGNPELLARIETCATQAPSSPEEEQACTRLIAATGEAALPSLDRRVLVALDQRGPDALRSRIPGLLRERGEPYSLAEIDALIAGLPAVRETERESDLSEPERRLWFRLEDLKRQRTDAVVRELRYEALDSLIESALNERRANTHLSDLSSLMWDSPEFLASLPPSVAHRNYLLVKRWLEANDALGRSSDRYKDDLGYRMLGMLARGPDDDELWRAFRASPDPLGDRHIIVPLVNGFTKRSDSLRQRLTSARTQGWFGASYLPRLDQDPFFEDPSTRHDCPGSWNPLNETGAYLPAAPGSALLTLTRSLSRDLERLYPSRDSRALARDFLRLRGFGKAVDDPAEALELVLDSPEAIRIAASRLFEGISPYPVPDHRSRLFRTRRATLKARRHGFSVAPPEPAGPDLDEGQRGDLDEILRKRKAAYFEGLVRDAKWSLPVRSPSDQLLSRLRRGNDGDGRTGKNLETKDLVSGPCIDFLSTTETFEGAVRKLLTSTDPIPRQGAAWALWNWRRDPAAIRVFLEDVTNASLEVRAHALDALRRARYAPAAALFPPLLHEGAPELRQIGLRGVRHYRIGGAAAGVVELVRDSDPDVADTAVAVLGDLRPPGSRAILMRLLSVPGPRALKAQASLARFRRVADIDAFLARMEVEAAPDQERWMLAELVSEITLHPFPQTRPSAPPMRLSRSGMPPPPAPEPLQRASVRSWRDWWRRHRDGGPGERLRSAAGELVDQYLKGSEEEASRASKLLAILLVRPDLAQPPSTQLRKIVEQWWRGRRASDPWGILDPFRGVSEVIDLELDRAMEIDPARTKQRLFDSFAHPIPIPYSYTYLRSRHDNLVQGAGVDFGDPALARCGARENIVMDWTAWAESQGWMRR